MKRLALLSFALIILVAVVGCGFGSQARNVLQPPAQPTAVTEQTVIERVVVVTATSEPAVRTLATTVAPPTAAPVIVAPQQMGLLQEESLLVDLYNRVSPSVVHIRVAQKIDLSAISPQMQDNSQVPDDFYQGGQGSGFVWDQEGHIITNHHVIAGADIVEVTFLDGTVLEAEVVGSDDQSDIAVIRVDRTLVELTPVELGDSHAVQVGQLGIAIGNPFGQTWTMTRGIVSAVGRTIRGQTRFSIPEVIQTDAAVNPGNSGGPLLDSSGRVIGMNTQIISESGSSAGIGFAVPIDLVKMVAPELIESGHHAYAYLGVTGRSLLVQDVEAMDLDGRRGALVIEVAPDSPAAAAALRGSTETIRIEGQDIPTGGDVIIGIEDAVVRNMDDLITYLVQYARPGQTVTLTVLRDGSEMEIPVTLAERPSE